MNNPGLNNKKTENELKSILFIQSSPRGLESYSYKVAKLIVDGFKAKNPDAKLVRRNLAEEPPPHVDSAFVGALFVRPEQRTPQQANSLALSDALIDELIAADTIVIAIAVHNFGIPSTLKAWIDHVVRAGRTFAFSQNGPQGLVKDRRAVLVLASGGVFSDGPAKSFDFHEPYLRAILGFIGIVNVEVVRVEGVAVSAIGAESAVARGLVRAKEVVAQAA
jgi:FMN-dependent NADH-azoreductase